jgi:sec-independent protein translocase protein TatC
MTLIFSFGLVFQLPVVTSLLVRADLIGSRSLADKRKYAIVIAFIVAAVLTPPDPISQLGLAIPTILLYEISILSARVIERGRTARRTAEAAAEAAEDGAAEKSEQV